MGNMEDIDKRIDEYSGLFDLYIEGKPIPQSTRMILWQGI